MEREELADTIIASHFDATTRSRDALVRRPARTAATSTWSPRTRQSEGFFLIWNGTQGQHRLHRAGLRGMRQGGEEGRAGAALPRLRAALSVPDEQRRLLPDPRSHPDGLRARPPRRAVPRRRVVIELKEFQKPAADQIAERFAKYYDEPPMRGTRKNPRVVPFYQSLASITASGKTVILADAVATICTLLPIAPVVLWLSKGKVVVDQTYANLAGGGKYHHLLGSARFSYLAQVRPGRRPRREGAAGLLRHRRHLQPEGQGGGRSADLQERDRHGRGQHLGGAQAPAGR